MEQPRQGNHTKRCEYSTGLHLFWMLLLTGSIFYQNYAGADRVIESQEQLAAELHEELHTIADSCGG